MCTNSNQVLVNVKDNQCIEIHLPPMRNVEAECAAARDLKYSSMILWLYCSQRPDRNKFVLSPRDIEETMGLNERTYRTCKNELMEKGYLVKVGDNHYRFYEMPRGKEVQ